MDAVLTCLDNSGRKSTPQNLAPTHTADSNVRTSVWMATGNLSIASFSQETLPSQMYISNADNTGVLSHVPQRLFQTKSSDHFFS